MNIYEKISKIMEEVSSLQKDGKVAFGTTKYNYLSEAKTTEIFHAQFVKHKLVLLPVSVDEKKEGQITQGQYTYKLVNAENPEEQITLMSGGQGHDSADKGSGKASSYAYKYLLWRLFAIPSNDDPDSVSSDEIVEIENTKNAKINKAKAIALTELATKSGSDISMLLSFYNAKNVEDLNEEQFAKAKSQYEKKMSGGK
ncbi:MAG: ERF family protein [Flavobacterium sp.]